jgi:hypothetical protein
MSGKYSGTMDYRHQCGSLAGQNPKAIVINNDTIFNHEGMKDFVNWQIDRSAP